jgi:hypothetical protein
MHKGESLRHECIDAPEQMVLWDAVINDPQKQMIAGGSCRFSSSLYAAGLGVVADTCQVSADRIADQKSGLSA